MPDWLNDQNFRFPAGHAHCILPGMRVLVGGGLLASVALSGCWYFEPCADNVGGIKEGQRLETTVIDTYDGALDRVVESCGSLGDLGPDTRVTWQAHLSGSAETCEDDVDLAPLTVSSGELSGTGTWFSPPTLTLPGGCIGKWTLRLNELGNSPRFLGEPDKADPNWVLERTFQVTGDVAFCGAGELPASCTDAFIARTQALAEE